tara:strand:+ start:486 stop:671 length:186 start_codon:yes stop_codon:yes gene_type:complete
MKLVKKNTKLKILNKKVEVDPPKGYHWMEEKGRYYLMEGPYGPHPRSVEKAMFKLSSHSRG